MQKTKTTLLDTCDVIGCDQEWDIRVGEERRCYHHAKEKALEEESANATKN